MPAEIELDQAQVADALSEPVNQIVEVAQIGEGNVNGAPAGAVGITQVGRNQTARLRQEGDGNSSVINQGTSGNFGIVTVSASNGNTALVNQTGDKGRSSVTQNGSNNLAELDQDGLLNESTILQTGTGNTAGVTQGDVGNIANVSQTGTGHTAAVFQNQP